MIKLNFLDDIRQSINDLEGHIKPESILDKKIHQSINKINKNISKAKSKLNNLITNHKDVGALEKYEADLTILSEKMVAICQNLPHVFQARETRNIIRRIYDRVNVVIDPIIRPINRLIYFGVRDKQKNADQLSKLNKLISKFNKIQNEQKKLIPKTGKILNKYKAKFDKLSIQTEKLKKEIKILNEKVGINKMQLEKGNLLRKNCEALGGERITLRTADHVNLDSIFLDAKKFREKLADAGCMHTTLKLDNDSDEPVDAIYLSKEDYDRAGKEVIGALEGLGVFEEAVEGIIVKNGAGWQTVYKGDDVFLVRSSQLPKYDYNKEKYKFEFKPHALFRLNPEKKRWEIKENAPLPLDLKPIDTKSPPSGTIILTSGSRGIYEQNKKEMAFFLLRNMNVMVFNFRGYAQSEGSPTMQGLKLDLECAYQCVKDRSGHMDEQIVFKALCLSASTAAYVASKHPKTNIIVDQSFSSLRKLIKDYSGTLVEKLINKHVDIRENGPRFRKLVAKAAGYVISLFSPRIITSKFLAKNEGKVAIFYTHDDEFISLYNVEENIKAISDAGKLDHLTVMSAPGKHAESLMGIRASPEDFSKKESDSIRKKVQKLMKNGNMHFNKIKEFENKIDIVEKKIKSIESDPNLPEKISKNSIKKLNQEKQLILNNKIKEEGKLNLINLRVNKLNIAYRDLHIFVDKQATGQFQLEHFLKKIGPSGIMKHII